MPSVLSTPQATTIEPRAGPDPLCVLHVLAPAGVGGLERVVQALAVGQRQAGHRVCVALVLGSGAADHPLLEPLAGAGGEGFPRGPPPGGPRVLAAPGPRGRRAGPPAARAARRGRGGGVPARAAAAGVPARA